MRETISIDPVTRIEGHLAIRVETEGGRVQSDYSSGEMFRGFENILRGRHPLDGQQITQRICGVCPVSHGMESVLAQDEGYAVSCPSNGILARNLVQAANFIASHLIHFYHLSALDFIDVTAVAAYSGKDPRLNEFKAWVQAQMSSGALYPAAPFLPRFSGDFIENQEFNTAGVKHYLDAFEIRALAQRTPVPGQDLAVVAKARGLFLDQGPEIRRGGHGSRAPGQDHSRFQKKGPCRYGACEQAARCAVGRA